MRTMEGRITALEAGSFDPDFWVDLPLFTNWANFGSPYARAQYSLTRGGTVILRGLVQQNGVFSTISNMPVGTRPRKDEVLHTLGNGGLYRVNITAAGVLTLDFTSSGIVTTQPVWLSLSGLTWSVR